jgi:23S rRNA pseudouridine1911/1915/1917 synthase
LADTILEGVLEQGGERLDRALAAASGLSRERVKALLGDGRVRIDGGEVRQPSLKTAPGAAWCIAVPEPAEATAIAQPLPLAIVYEDEHLVVVDKPAGLVVHPAAGNLDGTLVNALLHHCRGQLSGIGGVARPGIVHRIDKDTSGLLVVAKSDRAHEGLASQFAAHNIERAYLAVCAGQPIPPAGTLRGTIARSTSDRKKMVLVSEREGPSRRGKHSVTHYRTVQRLDGAALLECTLETGRTHQVRVHLASIGHALLGDPVYGRSPASLRPILARLGFARQALHAARLGFVHPISEQRLSFASPLPGDMRELIAELGGSM